MARFPSPVSAVLDSVFGYDVFISYAHRDAKQYASKLCEALQNRDYRCFLDASELPSGETLRDGLVRALRRSQTLLLIASKGAFESGYVWLELDRFRRARPRGRVVPIAIGESIDAAPRGNKLAELITEMDVVWSPEAPSNLTEGPSENVLKSLLIGFDFTRRNTWRRRIVTGVSLVLLLLTIIASVAAWMANRALIETQRKAQIIQIRRLSAESLAERDRAPQRSLLFAAEALQTAGSTEIREEALPPAEQALRDVVAHTGGREIGRVGKPITVMVFSGKDALHRQWLAAGSEDHSLLLWNLVSSDKPRVLSGHEGPIRSLAFSPDGRWLVSGGEDGTVRLWALDSADPQANHAVLRTQGGSAVTAVAISPDGNTLVTAETAGTQVHVWDLSAVEPFANCKRVLEHSAPVRTLTFGSNPATLIAGSKDGRLRVWDLHGSEAMPMELGGHLDEVTSVAISSDERWLLTGGKDNTVRLWDWHAPNPSVTTLVRHAEWVHAVGISPDGHWAVSAGGDGRVFRWDLKSMRPSDSCLLLAGHGRNAVVALAFSSDSRWLATAGDDQTARFWDLSYPDPTDTPVLRGHDGPLSAVTISSDNQVLFTASRDGSVRRWALPSQVPDPAPSPQVLRGHDGQIFTVAISADGRYLATGCEDGVTRLWTQSPTDPMMIPQPLGLPGSEAWPGAPKNLPSITALAISPDNHWLVSSGIGAPTRLWNLKTSPIGPPIQLGRHDAALAFSEDGRWLVAGGEDKVVRIWDLKSYGPTAKPRKLLGHELGIVALSISHDHRWLVTGSEDKTARLWDLNGTDEEARIVLRGHSGKVAHVAISPDNHWLATASLEKTVRLWDLSATDPTATARELSGHDGNVTSLAFSPDSRWLVTGSEDRSARLWDLSTGGAKPSVRMLSSHDKAVSAVAISGGKPRVITASYDMTAKLWDPTATDPGANPVVLSGHTAGINAIAVSQDGRYLLTGSSSDWQARLWLLQNDDLVELARKTAGRDLTEEEKRVVAGQ